MKRHLAMESDTDSTNSSSSRLGKCEVCNAIDAKYTCPKCEVKTCNLSCLTIHKKELNCNGIRDRTKYISVKKMTKMDFQSDYNFLEECTQYVEARKNDKIKRITHFNKFIPSHLFKLRNAARDRNITLRFLLPNFTRNTKNTSRYDNKSNVIYWRIEWIFTEAGNLKFIDEHCSESDKLTTLLEKYLNPSTLENVPMKKSLEFYQSRGIGNIKILLKAEGIKKCKNRFYQLNPNRTLKENLVGKTVIEFPIIYLIYNDLEDFNIIDSDEDVEMEAKQYRQYLDDLYRKQLEDGDLPQKSNLKSEKEVQEDMQRLNIERKRKERRMKREKLNNEPTNYLFANEKLWNESLSSSDTEEDIEDTKENPSVQKLKRPDFSDPVNFWSRSSTTVEKEPADDAWTDSGKSEDKTSDSE